MKSLKNRANVIGYSAGILFVFALISVLMLYNTNAKFRSSLNDARLKSENLLSEKLSLEKQIAQFKNDISSLTGKNSDLDKLLQGANQKIKQKEIQLSNIVRENKKVDDLESRLAAIRKLKDELQNERDQLSQTLGKIKTDNKDLQDQIAALNQKNKSLEEDNKLLQALNVDNFQLESLKGKKGKLTVNSKKANKLNMSFDVPENLTEHINFVINTPSGKAVHSDSKNVSLNVVENDDNLTASLSPYSENFVVSKRIEMNYHPKEKLKSGIYKIEVFNGQSYLGSCQIRLK